MQWCVYSHSCGFLFLTLHPRPPFSLPLFTALTFSPSSPLSLFHRIGPKGTALCVYPAYDSFTLPGGDGNNRGVFDIYREPILQSNENHLLNGETDNNLVEVRT